MASACSSCGHVGGGCGCVSRPRRKVARCRSCSAEIIWALTARGLKELAQASSTRAPGRDRYLLDRAAIVCAWIEKNKKRCDIRFF